MYDPKGILFKLGFLLGFIMGAGFMFIWGWLIHG